MPAMAPPPPPASALSTAPLSSVARGKKRARFEDDEVETTVKKATAFGKVIQMGPRKHVKSPARVKSPAKKSEMEKVLEGAGNGAMRRGLYISFIESAFAEKPLGRMDRYNELLAQFRPLVAPNSLPPLNTTTTSNTTAQIQLWLGTLTAVVSRLDRSHTVLVDTVLSLPWTVMDEGFVAAYTRFVGALVSARNEWAKNVVDKIVRGFQYRPIAFEARSSLLPADVKRRTIYMRLHSLLQSLLRLIPTLPSTLWPLLDLHFPNKRDHRDAHVCYTSNVLQIIFYCPALSENILEAVVGRAIKMDVEIQVEVEDWEDEDGHLEEEIFGREIEEPFDKAWADEDGSDDDEEGDAEELDFDDISSDEGALTDSDDEEVGGPSPESVKKVKEMAAKLDAILRCIFDHLDRMNGSRSPPIFTPPSSAPPLLGSDAPSYASSISCLPPNIFDPEADEGQTIRSTLFELLLSTFEHTILRTNRTRHTQFILFWYASLHPDFTDQLLGMLVEAALYDDALPVVTRVAAAGYIASLVGRAKYIDKASARHVMTLLCTRIQADLDHFGPASSSGPSSTCSGAGGNEKQYAVWYAVAQAVFYIFCFRWRDLMVSYGDEDEEGDEEEVLGTGRWLPALRVVERAISSHLNPLKACAPTVVAQFAKISHQVDFLYCYGITRANDRPSFGSTTSLLNLSRPDTPPQKGPPGSTISITTNGKAASVALPPPTANPLVRRVLAEAKMDSFFPFDPFKLPLSSKYLEDIYRVWEGGPNERRGEDDNSDYTSDEDEDQEERDNEEGSGDDNGAALPMAMSSSGRLAPEQKVLGNSFEAMSISPVRRAAMAA